MTMSPAALKKLVAALSYDMKPQMVPARVSFMPQRGRIAAWVAVAQTIIGGNCLLANWSR